MIDVRQDDKCMINPTIGPRSNHKPDHAYVMSSWDDSLCLRSSPAQAGRSNRAFRAAAPITAELNFKKLAVRFS